MALTIQTGVRNVNMHSQDKRGGARFSKLQLNTASSDADIITAITASVLAQVTSITEVVQGYPQYYVESHTAGSDRSAKVILQDADRHYYRIDLKNLAPGKSCDDVAAAFEVGGVLLPNSMEAVSSVTVTERSLVP